MNIFRKVVEGGVADPVLVSLVHLGDLLPFLLSGGTRIGYSTD